MLSTFLESPICIKHAHTKTSSFRQLLGFKPTTMSRFAQHKSRGPPAPPRRRVSADDTKPKQEEEECEDEYGGMYEPPPCERPLKVPQMPIEENIYLETTPMPVLSKRQAPPKPPDVDRSDKPGKKKEAPKPTLRRDKEAYLEPGAEDSYEDVYLEPEAYSPPRDSKMMTALPKPLLKPPIPGDKLSSLSSSVNITGPPPEARRFSLAPAPTKTQHSLNLKERMSSPQEIPVQDIKPAIPFVGRKKPSSEPYLAGDCDRKTAEDLLQRMKKDGAFLIRYSSTRDPRQPYTLAVWYQHKVYNVPVRFLEDKQGYALGKEGKKNEEIFGSLDDMISHHKSNQLLLIDSKSQAKHTTYLTFAAHR